MSALGSWTLLWMPLLGLPGGPAGEDCRTCGDTGLAPCPRLARHACPEGSTPPGTPGVARACSIAFGCPSCEGTSRVPCERCKHEPDPAYAEERAAHRAWLGEMQALDATLECAPAHARSEHFLLSSDLQDLDVRGGENAHAALHLYLGRLEVLEARFAADLGVSDADYLGTTHVLLWRHREDQQRAAQRLTHQSSDTESKLMGQSPVVTIFYDKAWLHEDAELHQAVVHQVTHCLLSNVWDGIWPGNIHGGWLDEGLAHAYELALFERVRHYCYVESDTIRELGGGSWEALVGRAVQRGEAPGLLGVTGRNTIELVPEEHPFAWSYVDYLLRDRPAQLGPLARAIKSRRPLKEALQETLQWTPFEFEEHWSEFVRTHYDLDPKKRKKRR